MPCLLPKMLTNEHCACRAASSVAPSVESLNSVSVMGYAVPTLFWMWVAHSRRFAVGVTLVVGSQGAALTAAATILMTPVIDFFPVSGLEVRSVLTDHVRRSLWDNTHPQHSVSCSS